MAHLLAQIPASPHPSPPPGRLEGRRPHCQRRLRRLGPCLQWHRQLQCAVAAALGLPEEGVSLAAGHVFGGNV